MATEGNAGHADCSRAKPGRGFENASKESQVIRACFGLDGREPLSMERIGRQMGVSRERVRQIRNKALARMRR